MSHSTTGRRSRWRQDRSTNLPSAKTLMVGFVILVVAATVLFAVWSQLNTPVPNDQEVTPEAMEYLIHQFPQY